MQVGDELSHPRCAGVQPGDLLAAVLRAPAEFWSGHLDLAARLRRLLLDAQEPVAVLVPQVRTFLDQQP
ncbi:hypothetical protein AB0M54_38365 [Actinoplanes sp. NPDC051470]|uniref:hypothetical protein n=1 Tax=unclassified Actinoplanes TaxID=2626549 RepID=UPI0034313413